VFGEETDVKPPIIKIHLAAVNKYYWGALAHGNYMGWDAGDISHVIRVEPRQTYFLGTAFLDLEVNRPAEDGQEALWK
jgi:hypothetical protein